MTRTRNRVAGRVRGPTGPSSAALLGLAVAFALVAGACGDSSPPTPGRSQAVGAAASSSPGSSGDPGPQATAWPGNAVLGIEALGSADGQILAAINEFNRGIATEDLALMRRAADGLAGLDVLLPNMAKINIYEPMRPFATRYEAAIRGIVAAAKAVRSAIDAGDAAGITTSSRALITSLGAYTDVQPELASWVDQSIKQRRLLVK
jgi:hypothetical protein